MQRLRDVIDRALEALIVVGVLILILIATSGCAVPYAILPQGRAGIGLKHYEPPAHLTDQALELRGEIPPRHSSLKSLGLSHFDPTLLT
jgi:hypothetical protein